MADFKWEDHPEAPKFNWDEHPVVEEPGVLNKAAHMVTRSLPAVGSILGGTAGIPLAGLTGPLASVGLAGLGYAGGEALKNTLESAMGDDKTEEQIYMDPIIGLAKGATYEAGGQVAGKVLGKAWDLTKGGYRAVKGKIASGLGKDISYVPKENAAEIVNAAEKLGINDVPKAVTSSNPGYNEVESGLSQSGSLPAREYHSQYANFNKGVENAAGKISDLRTPESAHEAGSAIQQELSKEITSKKAPVSEMYQALTKNLQKIQVNKSVVNKVFGVLKKNPIFATKDGQAMLEEYKNIVSSQPELNSLKELRTNVGKSLSKDASELDDIRVNAIRDAITSVRDNTIHFLKKDLPEALHGEVDDLIDQVALADKAHAGNINDLNSIRSILGNKPVSSQGGFLSKLGDQKEAEVAAKAANLDVTSLTNMKEKFPSVFEKAKQWKINDMIQSATNTISGFNPTAFLKKYNSLGKEMKDLIFDKEMQEYVESLSLIKREVPKPLGPSGTPKGIDMMSMLSPRKNIMDYGIKKVLKDAMPIDPMVNVLKGAQGLEKAPIQGVFQGTKSLLNTTPAFDIMNRDNEYKPKSNQIQPPQSSLNKLEYNKDEILQKAQGSKYAQVLQNAAQKGDQSLAAAHFVLSSRDKKYRDNMNNGGEDSGL